MSMSDDPAIQPDEGIEEPQVPSAWSTWEQAGFKPDANPYEVRKAVDYYAGLQDRQHRDYVLETTLRGNELPEGMTWQEAKQIIREHNESQAAQVADPWQAAQVQQDGEGEGYFDPEAFLKAIDQRVESRFSAYQQEREREAQQTRYVNDFGSELARVQQEHSLDEDEMQIVTARAWSFAADPSMQGAQIRDIVGSAHKSYQDAIERRLAAMAGGQRQVPVRQAPSGATPAGTAPPKNVAEAMQQTPWGTFGGEQ